MGIGDNIRIARMMYQQKHGKCMRQEDLAEKIGKERSFISLIERGKRKIPAELLGEIAEVLEVSVQHLHGIDKTISNNIEAMKRSIIKELKENDQYGLPPEIMELAKEMQRNREFADFCRAAKKLINRSYVLPNAAELLDIFAKSIDEAHKREAEGKSSF